MTTDDEQKAIDEMLDAHPLIERVEAKEMPPGAMTSEDEQALIDAAIDADPLAERIEAEETPPGQFEVTIPGKWLTGGGDDGRK